MRVLHVVPSYLPALRYGGTVFATHALCAALAAQGCDVSAFTTSVDGPGDLDVPLGVPVLMDNVKVWYFRSPFLRRLYYSPAMARALQAHCGGFDLLHLHSVYLWPTAAAARAARGKGVPYLVSPRGMLVDELIERKSRWLKTAWITLVERRNIERASGVHVTSALEVENLRQFGFALPPVYEVPNGVGSESDAVGPGAPPVAAAELLARGRPVVLFLGRINWKKGLDRLIPAMAKLPEADLLIAGNDDENYSGRLMARARELGVEKRVIFTGPIYGAAKAEIYRKAAVFVLPSYSENFGNVVLEAMLEGCPVVVTPEVGAANIVRQSGGGVIAEGDPESLAAAMRRLLGDAVLRDEMGRNGQKHMREKYSWDAVGRLMLDVYGKILARPAEGAR